MRFGTRVLPMVGLLAVLDRLVATTTRVGQCRGGQRRSGPPGRADHGQAFGILDRKG